MTTAEISDALNLHSIKDHEWQIQPCCALTGEGYLYYKIISLLNFIIMSICIHNRDYSNFIINMIIVVKKKRKI